MSSGVTTSCNKCLEDVPLDGGFDQRSLRKIHRGEAASCVRCAVFTATMRKQPFTYGAFKRACRAQSERCLSCKAVIGTGHLARPFYDAYTREITGVFCVNCDGFMSALPTIDAAVAVVVMGSHYILHAQQHAARRATGDGDAAATELIPANAIALVDAAVAAAKAPPQHAKKVSKKQRRRDKAPRRGGKGKGRRPPRAAAVSDTTTTGTSDEGAKSAVVAGHPVSLVADDPRVSSACAPAPLQQHDQASAAPDDDPHGGRVVIAYGDSDGGFEPSSAEGAGGATLTADEDLAKGPEEAAPAVDEDPTESPEEAAPALDGRGDLHGLDECSDTSLDAFLDRDTDEGGITGGDSSKFGYIDALSDDDAFADAIDRELAALAVPDAIAISPAVPMTAEACDDTPEAVTATGDGARALRVEYALGDDPDDHPVDTPVAPLDGVVFSTFPAVPVEDIEMADAPEQAQ